MNVISANTTISELIKMNSGAIDAIAAINPHFKKLRNPILRKLLASRVTIADAARIGKCELTTFFEQLKPLGFVIEHQEIETHNIQKATYDRQYDTRLDVRADIENGNDPFKTIMKAIKELKPGGTLLLVNSFEPTPLIKILKGQGYISEIFSAGANEIHTYISKGESTLALVDDANPSEELFEEKEAYFQGRLSTIDVRSLPMPQPMMTILKHLETLETGMALYVMHKRIPKFLLPELKERNYELVYRQTEDGVRLIIYKKESAT